MHNASLQAQSCQCSYLMSDEYTPLHFHSFISSGPARYFHTFAIVSDDAIDEGADVYQDALSLWLNLHPESLLMGNISAVILK